MREAWPVQGFLFLSVCELTVTQECQVWLVGQFRLRKPSSPGAMLGPCEAGQVPSQSSGAVRVFNTHVLFPYFIPQIKEGRVIFPSYQSGHWVVR